MSLNLEARHELAPANGSIDRVPSSPLRIAFCLRELRPLRLLASGALTDASYIQQGYVAEGLRSRGHKLSFVASGNYTQIVCTTNVDTPRLAPMTWSRSLWFDIASRGSWRIQQWLGVPYLNVFSNYRLLDACLQCLPGHDLVYERHSLYQTGIAMACKRLRIPYVLFFDADEILESDFTGKPITGLLRWRAQEMVRFNLNAADCVICVAKPAKIHLMESWRVPQEKIVVFPNSVDVEQFRPRPEVKAEIRATLGISTNPLIVFVGNFYGWHDVVTLLDAFARVLASHPSARLVLAGEGSTRPAMLEHAVEIGIAHAVHFSGSVAHAEVPRLVAAADVAVAPYSTVGHDLWLSPMKLFEYMASGTTIVATDAGQIAEVITDGHNGLLVPPGDVSAMASAFTRLLEDPTLRARLSQQARDDAVRKHSWTQYVSRLESVCAAVIAGQPLTRI